MTWHAQGIDAMWLDPADGEVVVHARADSSLSVQCYVSGQLVAWQRPLSGSVRIVLPAVADREPIALLGVDPADQAEDFYREAFGDFARDRVWVMVARRLQDAPGSRLRIRLGPRGAAEAEAQSIVHVEPIHPSGYLPGGLGQNLQGAFGFDGTAAAGFGSSMGLGELGFDADLIRWKSEPLAPGTWPVAMDVLDSRGNPSVAQQSQITIRSFAGACRGLEIDAYDPATDTLELSWTPSEDLP
jgi:hypothetical protein